MRHAMANRRRNRQGGNPAAYNNRPQHNKATVFDSNGPDVRIRGTAFQIVEKYQTLAKDSAASGDRVLAENYLQHAEHYQRLISTWVDETPRYNNYSSPDRTASTENIDDGFDAPAPAQADVVVTRPVAAAPAMSDDDLGLPASLVAPVTIRAAAH